MLVLSLTILGLGAGSSYACNHVSGIAKVISQEGNLMTFVCEGTNDMCIKQTCDADGHWKIYVGNTVIKATPYGAPSGNTTTPGTTPGIGVGTPHEITESDAPLGPIMVNIIN